MTDAQKYKIENNNPTDMTLILEPWAEEFVVPPKSTIYINIIYKNIGMIETEVNPQYFVVGLWAGCRAEIFLDGKNVTPKFLSTPAFG